MVNKKPEIAEDKIIKESINRMILCKYCKKELEKIRWSAPGIKGSINRYKCSNHKCDLYNHFQEVDEQE